jgi:hypothetical protein
MLQNAHAGRVIGGAAMKIMRLALAAAGFLSVASPTLAAPPPLPVAPDRGAGPAMAVDPQRLSLAERYLVDIGYDRTLDRVVAREISKGLDAGYKSLEAEAPVAPAAMKSELYRATLDSVRSFMPQIKVRLVRILSSEYSQEELQALVDFYETPVGRSITAKSVDLAQAAGRAVIDLTPRLRTDIIRRFCAREPQCNMGSAGADGR